MKNLKISTHSTGNDTNILGSNRPSTSDSSFVNPNINSKLSAGDESSSSEDTEIVYRRGKSSLRALSDYESGDNDADKAGTSLESSTRVKTTRGTKKATTEDVHCTRIQFEDSSSSDSEWSIRITSRRGPLKILSDYETGESIDQAGESSVSSSRANQNCNNSTTDSPKQNDVDMSSESESVYKITAVKCKRPHNLFSTSDSSDSDTPVRRQRFRKRKRIISNSEESDEENINAAQSNRRGRRNQNGIPTTNGGTEYQDTSPQMTRQLRPKNFIQRKYAETDSDSSGLEWLKIIRGRYSDPNNTGSNSIQVNVMEGSSSSAQLNTRVNTAETERSTESRQETSRTPANRQQFIRRTRQSVRRNSELEVLRISSLEEESETSSDDNSHFKRLTRFRRFNNVSPPLQSYVDSNDSDSLLPFEPRRVRGRTVRIHYSDSDSNSEQTLNLSIDINNSGTKNSDGSHNLLIPPIMQEENSSDSDADSEKCPICFSCFRSKEVASPATCDHSFCTKCIQEWAKSNNTCPIDRKPFNKIMVRSSFNGGVVRELPVEFCSDARFWVSDFLDEDLMDPFFSMDLVLSSSSEEEEICCVCFSSDNSHNLILCDFCSNIYHMSCLTPALRYVPANDWFCPTCAELEVVPNLF